jgi:hypothetical protein
MSEEKQYKDYIIVQGILAAEFNRGTLEVYKNRESK